MSYENYVSVVPVVISGRSTHFQGKGYKVFAALASTIVQIVYKAHPCTINKAWRCMLLIQLCYLYIRCFF